MRNVGPRLLILRDPTPHDAASRGAVVLTLEAVGRLTRRWRTRDRRSLGDAAGMLGVTRRLRVALKHGARSVRLDKSLDLLAGMGFDVVPVLRNSTVSLQLTSDGPVT